MDVVEREQLTPGQAFGHWYYQAKFDLLLSHLKAAACLRPGSRIVDVGCGIGLFLTMLERTGIIRPEQLLGVDPAHSRPGTAVGGNATMVPEWPEEGTADVALLMDVLEHTPDDLAVLSDTVNRVEQGGHVFITVPAFSWLRSMHDRFLGHHRRYSCRSLRKLIERCGDLDIVEIHYYYASIFPAAVPVRLARRNKHTGGSSDLRNLPRWLNGLLKLITRAELRLASRNRVAGLSVVALCRKTAPAAYGNRIFAPEPKVTEWSLAA